MKKCTKCPANCFTFALKMSLTNSLYQDLRHRFQYGDISIRFILMQTGIFLVINFIHLFCWGTGKTGWFSLLLSQIAASADLSVLLYKPWTLLTYTVSHLQIFHFLSNMLMLYFVSSLYNLYMRESDWIPVYLTGGLAGYLFFWAVVHFIPNEPDNRAQLMGASASIFALLFATVAINPDHEINLFGIFRLKILYFALGFLLIGLFLSPSGNAGGYFSHVGGALAGYGYIRLRQSGIDLFGMFRKKEKGVVRRKTMEETRDSFSENEEEMKKVDILLDKINRSGYDSLTDSEKKFLQEYSRKN